MCILCVFVSYCIDVVLLWAWWGVDLMGLKTLISLEPIFLQCFDTVGWVIWPVKRVPDMTYNVFGGTLNLALSIYLSIWENAPDPCTVSGSPSALPYPIPKPLGFGADCWSHAGRLFISRRRRHGVLKSLSARERHKINVVANDWPVLKANRHQSHVTPSTCQ